MHFNSKALLSLALAGFAIAAPTPGLPDEAVNCEVIGVHTPGRSPPSPDRTSIEITGAFSYPLFPLSDYNPDDPDAAPVGGVWYDRATWATREDGRVDAKLRNFLVVEQPPQVVKEVLESTRGTLLSSYNFATFEVHEIECVIAKRT